MRICTFNVHLWTDKGDRSNTAAVIRLLRGLDCDVVALNEVLAEGAQLAEVARELGMHHALGKASWLGNALLSKRPLHDVETFAITRGYEEARSALIATVEDAAGQRFDVCSTHLAPQHESTRLGQLANLRRALERRAPAHLVMGDFNALRLSDYAPAALDALRATRAAREREEPRGEVVEAMDGWGYLDAFRLARAGDRASYAAELARPLPDGELATCWAGTRIDYVWMSPALLDARRVRSATHVENDASDHLPVVVDLA
jgi:endonuclease/exonuclease/phosphatase family metal-dependent hydrolase